MGRHRFAASCSRLALANFWFSPAAASYFASGFQWSWNIATIHPNRGVIRRTRSALDSRASPKFTTVPAEGVAMISVLIGVLIICVVGAICFWAIEKFINDRRLANLLKLLVVLICLGAILQRVLPLAGINWF
jgi:hypothetical protein